MHGKLEKKKKAPSNFFEKKFNTNYTEYIETHTFKNCNFTILWVSPFKFIKTQITIVLIYWGGTKSLDILKFLLKVLLFH